jgi:hypothetical protein
MEDDCGDVPIIFHTRIDPVKFRSQIHRDAAIFQTKIEHMYVTFVGKCRRTNHRYTRKEEIAFDHKTFLR